MANNFVELFILNIMIRWDIRLSVIIIYVVEFVSGLRYACLMQFSVPIFKDTECGEKNAMPQL